jgi:hypothetical protein
MTSSGAKAKHREARRASMLGPCLSCGGLHPTQRLRLLDLRQGEVAILEEPDLGRVPPATETSVLVEGLTTLAEIPTQLENPIIQTGQGSLTVKGIIKSGEYLQCDGGKTAAVFDENWNRLRELPVEACDYTMPTGRAPVSITTTQTNPLPWLEVQFMTEGAAMVIRAR